jgi:sugar lactone lactonase YvrE
MRSKLVTLLTGLAMGESPRWHDNRLWLPDWGTREILATDADGRSQVVVRTPFELPFCIDWLPDGRLLIVAGRENRVVRMEFDGTLGTHVDLRGISDKVWNEIVVDGRGNAYVNGGPGVIALVSADGATRQVADGIAFPNGMAITPDNRTLIIAESHGKKLTAFDIGSDGLLSHRRVWAELGNGVPDGICIDQEGAAWYADVPNKCCVRVREGGEKLQTIHVDRGCFACMFGGRDRRTLFIVAAEWRGRCRAEGGGERYADTPRSRAGSRSAIAPRRTAARSERAASPREGPGPRTIQAPVISTTR